MNKKGSRASETLWKPHMFPRAAQYTSPGSSVDPNSVWSSTTAINYSISSSGRDLFGYLYKVIRCSFWVFKLTFESLSCMHTSKKPHDSCYKLHFRSPMFENVLKTGKMTAQSYWNDHRHGMEGKRTWLI